MKPSTKDVAEFFKHTLHLGFSSQSEIAKWADSLIENQKSAAPWHLELSNAVNSHPTDLIRILRQVSGNADNAEVGKMVFGRIAKKVEEKRMTPEEFLELSMRFLFEDFQLSDLLVGKLRKQFFDIVQAWDVVELGGKTKAEFDKMVFIFLENFRGFDFRLS